MSHIPTPRYVGVDAVGRATYRLVCSCGVANCEEHMTISPPTGLHERMTIAERVAWLNVHRPTGHHSAGDVCDLYSHIDALTAERDRLQARLREYERDVSERDQEMFVSLKQATARLRDIHVAAASFVKAQEELEAARPDFDAMHLRVVKDKYALLRAVLAPSAPAGPT